MSHNDLQLNKNKKNEFNFCGIHNLQNAESVANLRVD